MDVFRIKDFEIRNRLFVGRGKYQSYPVMQQALEASGCQVVTVAVRRERLVDKEGRSLFEFLDKPLSSAALTGGFTDAGHVVQDISEAIRS